MTVVQDVFILSKNGEILFGNVEKFQKFVENDQFNILEYPTTVIGTNILSQLKINDIILCLVHINVLNANDTFLMFKMLLNIKNHLQNKGLTLKRKFLLENYFLFLKELYNVNMIGVTNKESNKIKTDNIYMDVVEQYQTIIENGKVLKNSVYGEVIYKDNREITAEIILKNNIDCMNTSHNLKTIHYDTKTDNEKSNNEKDNKDDLGRKHVQVYYKNGNKTLLTYNVNNISDPLITLTKNGDFYKFKCETGIKFKTVKISIPMPETTYDAKIECKNGELTYNRKENVVEWRNINFTFKEETLYISPVELKKTGNVQQNNIKIEFQIENYADTYVKVSRSEAIFNQNAKIWVKYYTQASHYEIR